MQRNRSPRLPTTPRAVPRRLIATPTNLRIQALRYMPGTRLGEEERQFLGEMVQTQRELQQACVDQRQEAAARANLQNQALTRIIEAFRDRELEAPRPPVLPIAPPPQEDTLSRGILDSVPFFAGNKTDSAREWIEAIEDLGRASGWQIQTYRRAAISRVQGSARDWHMLHGVALNTWALWREQFLATFEKGMEIEEWTREVEALVRLPNQSIHAYSLSKQRLCARCPVALTEPQVIKRLVRGLNSSTFKSVVISGDPRTLAQYYNIIRRLDDADLEADGDEPRAKGGPVEKEAVPPNSLSDIESVVEKCLKKFERSIISPEPWGGQSRDHPPPALPDWRARGNIGTNFGAASAQQDFGYSRPPSACFNCHRLGHHARDCPETRFRNGGGPVGQLGGATAVSDLSASGNALATPMGQGRPQV